MKCTILIVLAMAAAACERSEGTKAEEAEEEAEKVDVKAAEPAAADNTEKNERDRKATALTPGDQGESEADRTITQRVRQGVVGHDGLSTTATNVKIITVDGVVTLRGPVKSAEERSTIESIAQRADGVKRVDNQLEIASQ